MPGEAEAVRDADPATDLLAAVIVAVLLSAKTCGLYEYFRGLGIGALISAGAKVVYEDE